MRIIRDISISVVKLEGLQVKEMKTPILENEDFNSKNWRLSVKENGDNTSILEIVFTVSRMVQVRNEKVSQDKEKTTDWAGYKNIDSRNSIKKKSIKEVVILSIYETEGTGGSIRISCKDTQSFRTSYPITEVVCQGI